MDEQKLLVLSDTHGQRSALKAVLTWANTQPIDTAIFLGDGTSDIAPAADAVGFYRPWKIIRGNNDFDFTIPDTGTLDFGGKRFFLCHGHRHNLYGGYNSLVAAARKAQADAIFFGHTHVPYCKEKNGILLFNPGSAGIPRSRAGATFATVTSEQGKPITAVFWMIGDGGIIQELKFD
jgi:putative phosphoesterase